MKILIILMFLFLCGILCQDKQILPGSNWVGMGYDVLTNDFRTQIFDNTFLHQKLTEDREFIIGDDTTQISMSGSRVHIASEVIESVMNYTDSTMSQMKLYAKFPLIGGSFGSSHRHIRKMMSDHQHLALVTTAEITQNALVISPDSAKLKPDFEALALKILTHVNHRTPQTYKMARSLINDMLRIYGIEFLHEVRLGGTLTKIDVLNKAVLSKMTRDELKMTGGIDFAGHVGIEGEYDHSEQKSQTYRSKLSDVTVDNVGGLPWNSNLSFADWENSTFSKPGVINKLTMPISVLFSATRFPQFDDEVIYFTKMIVDELIQQYIDQNTHCGCTDPASPNYSPGFNARCSCDMPMNFTTGGFYQISDCQQFNVSNPVTNNFSCPAETHPVLIASKFPERRVGRKCIHVCHHKWVVIKKCHNECWNYFIDPECKLYTYMCRMNNHTVKNGAAIGGFYSSKAVNPQFSEGKCGNAFVDMTVAHNGFNNPKDGVHICLAPVNGGTPPDYTVRIGGVFNNNFGNPLTKHHSRRCPPNYIRYPLGSQNGNPWFWCAHHEESNAEIKLTEPGGNTWTYPIGHYWPKCNSTNTTDEYIQVNASSPVPFWLQVPYKTNETGVYAMKPPKRYFERISKVFPSVNFTLEQPATFEEICFEGTPVQIAIEMMHVRPINKHNSDNTNDGVIYSILFYVFTGLSFTVILGLIMVILVLSLKLRRLNQQYPPALLPQEQQSSSVYNSL